MTPALDNVDTLDPVDPVDTPRGASAGLLRFGVPVVVAVVLAAAPFFLAPYALSTLTRMLVFGLLAASLALLVGVSGLPSLGHAAYFGAGAYAGGSFSLHVSAQAPWSLLIAAVAGGAVAAATGWVAVRTRGVYFLMLTLAIGEIVRQIAVSWEQVTGGSNGLYGIPAPQLGGDAGPAELHWYVLVAFGVGFAVLAMVVASPFGAALRGVHDNEPRMRALGYPTALYKYAVFVIAGTVAGLAGGLYATGTQERIVTPEDLGFTTAALVLLAVIIGGAGSLWGACLGAALVVYVRDALGPTLGGHGPLVLGAVFILVVFLMPRGFAGLMGLPGLRGLRRARGEPAREGGAPS